MKKKQKKRDNSANRGTEPANTYFSYNGPTHIETSFSNPAMAAEDGGWRDRFPESSPSETADKASTIPIRPRPLLDQQNVVLLAPNSAYPGYVPLGSRLDSSLTEPSDDFYLPRRKQDPYRHSRRLKHMVVFMAAVFVVSLMILVFVAVYLGRRLG